MKLVHILILHFNLIHLKVPLLFHFFLLLGNLVSFDTILNIIVELLTLLIWQLIEIELKLLVVGLLVLSLELLHDRNDATELDGVQLTYLFN